MALVSRKIHSLSEGDRLKIKFIGNVQFSLAPGDSVSSGSWIQSNATRKILGSKHAQSVWLGTKNIYIW